MPIMFNSLLTQNEVDPAKVILLRHQDRRAERGRTPYELWRDKRSDFEGYQSIQEFANRPKCERAAVWASFVGTPDGATMFVGMYAAKYNGLLVQDTPQPHADGIDLAGSRDVYDLRRDDRTVEFEGKLFIAWGEGARAWVQRADRQNKAIAELRPEFKEREFPGFLNLVEPLFKVATFPKLWIYSAYVTTRNCFGLMTRKLSVTALVNSRHLLGTSSRRKPRVASAKSL